MARERIVVGGLLFDVYHVRPDEVWNSPRRKTLGECYERPSSAKVKIFNDWDKWVYDTPEASGLGITSYNTFGFTLRADYKFDPKTLTVEGEFVITKTNNKLYLFD